MNLKFIIASLMVTVTSVAVAPGGAVDGLPVGGLVNRGTQAVTPNLIENLHDKRDPECKRGCHTNADCCHADVCFANVCLGPQDPPMDKRDPKCKRRCRFDADCCHADVCFANVCIGPQDPPRV